MQAQYGMLSSLPVGTFMMICSLQAAPSTPAEHAAGRQPSEHVFHTPVHAAVQVWTRAYTFARLNTYGSQSREVLSNKGGAFCTTQPAMPACAVCRTRALPVLYVSHVQVYAGSARTGLVSGASFVSLASADCVGVCAGW